MNKHGKDCGKGPARAIAESEQWVLSGSTKHATITRTLVHPAQDLHVEVGMMEHHQVPPDNEEEDEGDNQVDGNKEWSMMRTITPRKLQDLDDKRPIQSLAMRAGSWEFAPR